MKTQSTGAQLSPFFCALRFIQLCSLVLLSMLANATTYYMATPGGGGNDGNNGLSTSAPFASIVRFMGVAQPGDELQIRGGRYYPAETFITKSGSSGNYITIRNYPGETPIFDGQRQNSSSGTNGLVIDDGVYSGVDGPKHHLIFDGLVFVNWKRGGFYFGDSGPERSNTYISCYDIVIRNCVVDYCGQLGIRVTHGDNIEISNCILSRTGWDINFGSWSSGINLYNCPGRNLVVRNCVSFHHVDISKKVQIGDNFYGTDGNGMILDMFEAYDVDGGATVENCLMFENGGAGIAWTRQSHANINNNTLVDNAKAADYIYPNVGLILWREQSQGNFTDINIRNNIVYQSNGGVAYRAYLSQSDGINVETTPSSGVITNNNITGLSGFQNPQFADAGNLDFSLQSSSPMIDAGTSSGVPSGSIVFDRSAIKSQTSGQPISWYRWEPDLDYITNKGGVAACFGSVSRPQGNGYDIGACERAGSGGGTPTTYTIYDDAMQNGWTSGGFNTNVNINNSSPVYEGSQSASVEFTGAYGAWTVSRSSPISTSGYNSIRFRAYGGSGGNTIQVVVKRSQGGDEAGRQQYIQIAEGYWQEFTVNLSDVGSPSEIGEIWIHENLGGSQSTFYVDNLRLSNGSGARVGRSNAERELTVKAFPNPVGSNTFVLSTPFSTPTKADVTITDIGGRVWFASKVLLEKDTKVNVNNLSSGLYIVEVRTATTAHRLKLVKQ